MSGVIAAGGPETAAAGAAMLRQGGNAVDAAVAAAFVSFIAEIGVVHWGGSGLAHIWDPHSGQSVIYDFFSTTPGLGLSRRVKLDFQQVTIDFGATTQDFHLGRASVAVPGNIFGLCELAETYGRLPLPLLLEPAITYATDGVILNAFQAMTCKLLEPLYTHSKAMRTIFKRRGRMIKEGERLFIPNLRETLQALAAEGAALMRSGALGRALVVDHLKHGGLLTPADLAAFEVGRRSPIEIPYRGYTVLLPPPSSSGGVLIAFALKLLSAFEFHDIKHGSTKHLQILYEVQAATNRARKHWDMAISTMSADEAIERFLAVRFVDLYVEEIRAAISNGQRLPAASEPRRVGNTSHLSVIDGDGMAVSLTTTAGESAGYVVPRTGFIPNNMLGEADLHPHGFHTRPAGERIPTMMSPTIVRLNGQTRVVIGTGGSERIRSAILQVLSNLIDFDMALEQAVNTARVHLERESLQCEYGFDAAAVDGLAHLGYPVNRWATRSIYFGGAHSVSRTPDGQLYGAGDTRRGGAVAVA